ncbi:MAG: hypothetical protein ABWY01_02400 [Pseudoxanthomonas sp.]
MLLAQAIVVLLLVAVLRIPPLLTQLAGVAIFPLVAAVALVLLAETVCTLAFLADATVLHFASQAPLVVANLSPATIANGRGGLGRALLELARGRSRPGTIACIGIRTTTVRLVACIAHPFRALALGLIVALASGLLAPFDSTLLVGALSLWPLGLLTRLLSGYVIALPLLAFALAGIPHAFCLFALLVAALRLLALDLFADLLATLLLAHRVLARGLLALWLALDLLRALLPACRQLTGDLLATLLGLLVVLVFIAGVAATPATTVLGARSGTHAKGQGRTQRDRPEDLLAGGKFHLGS